MIYMDNGATTWPKPESVYRAMDDFARHRAANPGRGAHAMALAAAAAVEDARLQVARLFHIGETQRLVFRASTTDALNLALFGLLGPRDHVVTSSMEHNSVSRPLRALQDWGVQVTRVQADPFGWVDPEALAAALTPATRLIVLNHVSNVTGTLQDVNAVGRLARERGVLLLVDAAQSAGVVPIDVERDGIDLLAFPGHKGLLGPMGTGGLYIGPRVDVDELRPLCYGGTGGNSEEDVPPRALPIRYEAGTLNAVGLAGLAAGVRFVLEQGVERILAHERSLAERLAAGLAALPGVRVYVHPDPGRRTAVVSFTAEGWEPGDLGAILDQSFGIACRTGLHCAPDAACTIGAFPLGTVRFCPGWFTTEAEIEATVDAVRRILAT
ncbi:MAG: aminotransferase class V-fold PLP-dependent enzyme [Anaerolineae bacterium]|nr:aminotransferase class V-fold PLP-dependent enzyme [Anaerolineae bacterium]